MHAEGVDGQPLAFCEDIVEIPGFVLASCDYGRGGWNTVMGPLSEAGANSTGRIWAIDMNGEARQCDLHLPHNVNFHPLGIKTRGNRLYAINHGYRPSRFPTFRGCDPDCERPHIIPGTQPHRIEVFDLSFGADGWPELHYSHEIEHPAMYTPNALDFVSDDLLLVSNDHFVRRRGIGHPKHVGRALLHTFETLFRLPGGSVLAVDISSSTPNVRTLARWIPFANGVALNGRTLAVSATRRRSVWFYELQGSTFEDVQLVYKREVGLSFGPDNLGWHDGKLLVAGHPASLPLLAHARSPYVQNRTRGGSWVSTIEDGQVQDVFVADGKFFATSSTAVRTPSGHLFVSGLYERGILVCPGVELA